MLLTVVISLTTGTLLSLLSGGILLRFPYPLTLLSLSLVAFSFYGYDKFQSSRSGGRIPEAVLHALALLGGFPGAWAGRTLFRHKTTKPVFGVIMILAALLHLSFCLFYLYFWRAL
ncbi:MAG: DUF1294 domain-containing protein [Fretibacterium sp.]|nr:DUF1294 domain-containing protein [Fretibacterium sp.]